MNGEFIEALLQIAKEKDIPFDTLKETVESALATAFKKNHSTNVEIKVRIDSQKGSTSPYTVYCERTIVDEPTEEPGEISLKEAQQIDPDAVVGEVIEELIPMGNFGRIAAQTAKQVVVQRIREA